MNMKIQTMKDASNLWAAPKQQQEGNSKKRISTGKDGIVRILSPVTAAEIQAVEKERKAKNILLMAIPKGEYEKFSWNMVMQKRFWESHRTWCGVMQIKKYRWLFSNNSLKHLNI
ncbi:hypothetical protein Tco_0726185 [Tanacetum coccineum]|uniref:Uncharacterized protein n=1 Tax=Tanacetum coccineum TaxID=301880 RepID=A0ABQ4YEX1_9ASTR